MKPTTFWRIVFGCESAFALAVAFAITGAAQLSAWVVLPVAVGVLVLLQYAITGASVLLSRTLVRQKALLRGALPAFRAIASEPLYFALAQLSMIADGGERNRNAQNCPAQASGPILLVHGLACNSGIWRWLVSRLRGAGFRCVHLIDLEPLRADIDALSIALEREVLSIQNAHAGSRVTVIAHSMGGLVARTLLRSLGPRSLRRIITVATPHHGAAVARVLWWPAAKQLCIGSPWLTALNASQEGHFEVPVTSLYSADDTMVHPAASAQLGGATLRQVRGLGHFGMIVSRRGLDTVMSALAEAA